MLFWLEKLNKNAGILFVEEKNGRVFHANWNDKINIFLAAQLFQLFLRWEGETKFCPKKFVRKNKQIWSDLGLKNKWQDEKIAKQNGNNWTKMS